MSLQELTRKTRAQLSSSYSSACENFAFSNEVHWSRFLARFRFLPPVPALGLDKLVDCLLLPIHERTFS